MNVKYKVEINCSYAEIQIVKIFGKFLHWGKYVLLDVHKLIPFLPSRKTPVRSYYLCVMDWSSTHYLWESRKNSLYSLTRKMKSQRRKLFTS